MRELTMLILGSKGSYKCKAPEVGAHWCVWGNAWEGWKSGSSWNQRWRTLSTENVRGMMMVWTSVVWQCRSSWILILLIDRMCVMNKEPMTKSFQLSNWKVGIAITEKFGGNTSSVLEKFEMPANTYGIKYQPHIWEVERHVTPRTLEKRLDPGEEEQKGPAGDGASLLPCQHLLPLCCFIVPKSFHAFWPLKNINRSHPAQ